MVLRFRGVAGNFPRKPTSRLPTFFLRIVSDTGHIVGGVGGFARLKPDFSRRKEVSHSAGFSFLGQIQRFREQISDSGRQLALSLNLIPTAVSLMPQGFHGIDASSAPGWNIRSHQRHRDDCSCPESERSGRLCCEVLNERCGQTPPPHHHGNSE